MQCSSVEALVSKHNDSKAVLRLTLDMYSVTQVAKLQWKGNSFLRVQIDSLISLFCPPSLSSSLQLSFFGILWPTYHSNTALYEREGWREKSGTQITALLKHLFPQFLPCVLCLFLYMSHYFGAIIDNIVYITCTETKMTVEEAYVGTLGITCKYFSPRLQCSMLLSA